jgi:hypothetical protein
MHYGEQLMQHQPLTTFATTYTTSLHTKSSRLSIIFHLLLNINFFLKDPDCECLNVAAHCS